MALIVEDGSNIPNADALASLAFVLSYQLGLGNEIDEDADLTEAAIRRVSQYIAYSFDWNGTPVNGRGQAFPFPMQDLTDKFGNEVSSTSVPIEVQRAVALGFQIELATPGAFSPSGATSDGNVKRARLKAGSVEEENEYFTGNSPASATVTSKAIVDLLAGLGTLKNVGGGWVGSFNSVVSS